MSEQASLLIESDEHKEVYNSVKRPPYPKEKYPKYRMAISVLAAIDIGCTIWQIIEVLRTDLLFQLGWNTNASQRWDFGFNIDTFLVIFGVTYLAISIASYLVLGQAMITMSRWMMRSAMVFEMLRLHYLSFVIAVNIGNCIIEKCVKMALIGIRAMQIGAIFFYLPFLGLYANNPVYTQID